MPTVYLKRLPHQKAAMESKAPYIALVTGIGGGKTWTGSRWLIRRACMSPFSVHLATANSFPQLRDVVVPELLRACDEFLIPYQYNKVENNLSLDLGATTAEIRIRSTERYDLLRGAEYGSWWGDEVRDASSKALGVVFGRLRCKRVVDRCKYLWTTTPNGFDYVWQRHVENKDKDYALFRAPSAANIFLPSGYVEGLRASYDEKMAAQEISGDFVVLFGATAYRAFDRSVHMKELAHNTDSDLHLCFDFNVSPMAVIICQEAGDEIHAIGEIVMRDVGIYEACAEIKRRYGAHRGNVVVHGDAAGHSRTAQTGRTSYALVREGLAGLGQTLEISVPQSNPSQRERVDTVNTLLRNSFGRARFFVDNSCRELQRDFEQVAFDQGGSLDKSDPNRTHTSDAVGYYLFRRHRPSGFKSEAGRNLEPTVYRPSGSTLMEKYGR